MVDFNSILSKKADEIEKPKPLPVGTYICTNPALPEFTTIGKKETPAAIFQLEVVSPLDDVDTDALAEFGDYRGKKVRHTLWLSEAGLYRAKQELAEAWGIAEEGKSLGEMLNETVNRQVAVTIKHRPSPDGTELYSEIERVSAV